MAEIRTSTVNKVGPFLRILPVSHRLALFHFWFFCDWCRSIDQHVHPYIDIAGTLLEGLYHDVANNEFRLVDTFGQIVTVEFVVPDIESLSVVVTAAAVGVTANIAEAGEANVDQPIVGAKLGFARLDRATGRLSYIREVWGERKSRMRFNDGAADSTGRFWAGVMNDPKIQSPGPEGVLFRLDPDLGLHRMLSPVTIPNGIGWNPADDTMYLIDSPTGKIFAFDFDAATGAISNRHVHFDPSEPLEPDGFAMDVGGCIWSAIYGGGQVVRISPEGTVIGQIDLPTRNPTCPAFVGTKLFITSAKDDRDNERFPQSNARK
ncbi:uncharacterized protein N7498_006600 [Penicillium cinerascens]|uniref:SMP-30/Gluconolactonase/LRE-like region domain-containing protein n=1 Tax=Penicillium cinerascens TaxID=70096 RepID=A0A9W9MIT8_9EURO|nr:uncharacterized protein N7498_006600 [Penicillium cinerascens]KAJ5201937.1 hypothetical protein N7498_006600 [Penicillium cinerascens]